MICKHRQPKECSLNEVKLIKFNNFLCMQFSELIPDYLTPSYGHGASNVDDILLELQYAEIDNLSDLERIIPPNFVAKVKTHSLQINYLSLLRILLMISDIDNFLDAYIQTSGDDWNLAGTKDMQPIDGLEGFLQEYGISYNYIYEYLLEKGEL